MSLPQQMRHAPPSGPALYYAHSLSAGNTQCSCQSKIVVFTTQNGCIQFHLSICMSMHGSPEVLHDAGLSYESWNRVLGALVRPAGRARTARCRLLQEDSQ